MPPDFQPLLAPATPATPALTAARRYAVLQPLIVEKRPFFEMINGMIEASGTKPARVVELGVGTGGFLEAVARARWWPQASLVGADLSPERIAVARETMAALGRAVALHDGVNALDADDPFYENAVPPTSADVVVLAQFEHYAPNDETSPLARRLSQTGRAWCPKAALRRLAASRLRPGGWMIVIDDFAAETAEKQANWDRAWDAHVVREFSSASVRQALDPIDPEWAAALARRYHPDRPLAQRLALAARARARRRHRDAEEVQELDLAWGDFRELFAEGQCGLVPHPDTAGHPQFYLMWGRR